MNGRNTYLVDDRGDSRNRQDLSQVLLPEVGNTNALGEASLFHFLSTLR